MGFFLYAVIAAAVIFVLLFALGYGCFLYSFTRRKSERPDSTAPINTAKYKEHEEKVKRAISEYDQTEKQTFSITSRDGLKLYASYIPTKEPTDKLIIAFHGYRSSARADFSPIFKKLLNNGYSLLLVDQRCHSRSDGKYIGFGVLERLDVCDWASFAADRFGADTKIYLYGVSMGAASVTMSSTLTLPKNVRGIIADCGFSAPYAIVKHVLRNHKKIPPYPTAYFINIWTNLLAGYDLKKASSIKAIKQSSLPLLLIHGAEDRYVPTEMSRIVYNARPKNTRLVIVEGARHARSHLVNETLYLEEIVKFIENN